MSGFFGVVSKNDCVFDLFYGTDYHSHLGTRRAGLVVHDDEKGFDRAIHNIESSNFRPKFALTLALTRCSQCRRSTMSKSSPTCFSPRVTLISLR